MKLDGKVAIITGAGRGMGAAFAVGFSREGAAVAVVDIDRHAAEATAAAIGRDNRRAVAIEADVSSSAAVRDMTATVLEEFGTVDFLVNNAGIVFKSPLLEIAESEWDRVLNTNLKGTLLCVQSVARHMITRKSGAIINISSIAADIPTPDYAHYGASKAAILHLTKTMALALAPHGIRVNAVQPGTIRTSMNEAELSKPEVIEQKLKVIALDHIGTPDEVADPVIFLASDEARYITGASLYVDGGAILLR